ncbi:eCIS core domain-containing protein [Hymenobacter perfusus]|uniref:eCIS core domain-containing protein n=1 Tax=Hymenobacter perfusus TaxID=1236770 RepID=UPI001B87ACA1|nr:DUF4157 domain-containing protein [Hymenobacter perfusus]
MQYTSTQTEKQSAGETVGAFGTMAYSPLQAAINNSPHLVAQRQQQAAIDTSPKQQSQSVPASMPARNRTGLPDALKMGVENLSGYSLDDVRVHYNSAQPAQLQAHAYAQGTDIHVAPGQEQHLPHEAWHVVQQKQGRVRATRQLKGVGVNDDAGLEQEADVMGMKATQSFYEKKAADKQQAPTGNNGMLSTQAVAQRIVRIQDPPKTIANMGQLREVMGAALTPFGNAGMIRSVIKGYILSQDTIDFDSIQDVVDSATARVATLEQDRASQSDDDIVDRYHMDEYLHPGTGAPNGYILQPHHVTRPAVDMDSQEYFYRAMTKQEAMTWLNPPGILLGDTGQPWASYFNYSLTYLTIESPYLLEVHAPGWLAKSKEIGIKGGKAESKAEGDLSFGIGETSESSTGFDKEKNKALKAGLSAEGVQPAPQGRKAAKTPGRSEALMLSSIYFQDSILAVRPVRILK